MPQIPSMSNTANRSSFEDLIGLRAASAFGAVVCSGDDAMPSMMACTDASAAWRAWALAPSMSGTFRALMTFITGHMNGLSKVPS